MIIGNGDISKAIQDRTDFLFFASGVSNSQCKDERHFERERLLLTRFIGEQRHLVYFSTLSIYGKETPYTRHKRRMENLIKANFELYTIVRIGNITWGSNPNTIINHFKKCIRLKNKVEIKDEIKYICGKSEFGYWLSKIAKFSSEMNIPGELITVKKLYERIKRGEFN